MGAEEHALQATPHDIRWLPGHDRQTRRTPWVMRLFFLDFLDLTFCFFSPSVTALAWAQQAHDNGGFKTS
jgi:hypothetical protein